MTELDDARLRQAMRSYLDACAALADASGLSDDEASRELIDRADAKTLAEMVLRNQLQRLGWLAPREVAPAENNGE
jgi:hypothetical protein